LSLIRLSLIRLSLIRLSLIRHSAPRTHQHPLSHSFYLLSRGDVVKHLEQGTTLYLCCDLNSSLRSLPPIIDSRSSDNPTPD
ncbi:hypothetical protein J6590_067924, partial [Homalodisca vitripennis]